jgi:hypothetical protein
MSKQFSEFIKNYAEPLNIFLLVSFGFITMYILLNCIDPAESTIAREKEIEFSRKCKNVLDKEKRDNDRYIKLIKKIEKTTHKSPNLLNGMIVTNSSPIKNEEHISAKLSNYANDRGGNQFMGQQANWYTSFSEQARLLYR